MLMQIIPAIMEHDFRQAEENIRLVKDLVTWVQIDVNDGVFTPGKTFELELLTKLGFDASRLLFDIHLMVKEPQNWIEKSMFAGATRITGQVEMMNDWESFVMEVKDAGLEAGLAFDINTEIKDIPRDTDVVLLMGRKAGFGSFEMDLNVKDKIDKLAKYRQEKQMTFEIGVDGGITAKNIELLSGSGVDLAFCGGAIFNGNVENNLWELKEIIGNR